MAKKEKCQSYHHKQWCHVLRQKQAAVWSAVSVSLDHQMALNGDTCAVIYVGIVKDGEKRIYYSTIWGIFIANYNWRGLFGLRLTSLPTSCHIFKHKQSPLLNANHWWGLLMLIYQSFYLPGCLTAFGEYSSTF